MQDKPEHDTSGVFSDIRLKIQDAVSKIDHLAQASNQRYGNEGQFEDDLQINLDDDDWLWTSKPNALKDDEPSEILGDYEHEIQDISAWEIEDLVGIDRS